MHRKSYRTWLAAALLGCSALGLSPPTRAVADIYVFDKGHTNITFSWGHLGLSRQSGRMLDYSGIVDFDPAAPEQGRVDVTMKVASLWTGVEALDKHLKSADFFDVERFPTITFRSTSAKTTGEKTGEVAGELTIMGITKPVTLQVTWNFTGEHPLGRFNANYKDKIASGFTATTRILRSEWGVTRGTPLTSDEIEITINTELLKK